MNSITTYISMSGAAGRVDDDNATRVFKCKVCGIVKHSERNIKQHMAYRINIGDVPHAEFVKHETMLLCQRQQVSNAMTADEEGGSDDHVIIRTCDVLEMRRPQHRADPVGETRRVGEGEENKRAI